MRNFLSLDYEFNTVNDCRGLWAAPLWMIPNLWQYGPGSGEIDSLESCPRNRMYMNFAGGGHQVKLKHNLMMPMNLHVTVRKDHAGIVTVATCVPTGKRSYQCPKPQYSNCKECLNKLNNYACYCDINADKTNKTRYQKHIYSSGGCVNGGDCIWYLVSDVWNGVDGDDGYYGCMTEVPSLGLGAAKPHMNSTCSMSVQRIFIRGTGGENGTIKLTETSPEKCKSLILD